MALTRTSYLAVLCLGVPLLGACAGDGPVDPGALHIVGTHGSWSTAFHWNAGELSTLDAPDGDYHVAATSVTLLDGVAVVGGSFDGHPCYWQAGVRNDLPCSDGELAGVAADAAGRLVLAGTCDGEAAVWVDGNRTALAVPQGFVGSVNALSVSGDDVCVAGRYRSDDWSSDLPCYWHNGARAELPALPGTLPGGTTQLSGIAASGGGCALSASYDAEAGGAAVWTGSAWSVLDGTAARAIDQDGSDLYVAGRDEDGACYWKNGSKTGLECVFSTIATAISAGGGAVAVAGKCGAIGQDDVIGYWDGDGFHQIFEASIADITGVARE